MILLEMLCQKLLAWAASRPSAMGPTPVDVGEVHHGVFKEVPMDAAGMQCYSCDDRGRAARRCPSERWGKGGKGRSEGGKDGG